MTRNEYENKINELGIDLQERNIVIGRKTNVPFSTGCYFEDGSWILYDVDERQNSSIIEKGNEDRMFKFIYDNDGENREEELLELIPLI
ncbi:hypothetical protein ABES23_02895 [Peribacillus frigoritolerans]|uniref:hypothetical protein n=1 Tax=Peribacillus frigoritolerans TaxID=450367 RepID=UPI003D2998B2